MNWMWVLVLSLTGLVMGLVTSLVGLPGSVEPLVWIAFYVAWGVLVIRRELRPFLTPLVASTLSGVWTGGTQYVLRDQYLANNPWYADQLTEQGMTLSGTVLFGVGMGVVWGLIVGGICWGVAKRRG